MIRADHPSARHAPQGHAAAPQAPGAPRRISAEDGRLWLAAALALTGLVAELMFIPALGATLWRVMP